jgi:hypothetical protein
LAAFLAVPNTNLWGAWEVNELRLSSDRWQRRRNLAVEHLFQVSRNAVQVDPILPRKARFPKAMIRIRMLPVMPATKRDYQKVRALLPHTLPAQRVRVGSFDYGRSAAQSRTDYASSVRIQAR